MWNPCPEDLDFNQAPDRMLSDAFNDACQPLPTLGNILDDHCSLLGDLGGKLCTRTIFFVRVKYPPIWPLGCTQMDYRRTGRPKHNALDPSGDAEPTRQLFMAILTPLG